MPNSFCELELFVNLTADNDYLLDELDLICVLYSCRAEYGSKGSGFIESNRHVVMVMLLLQSFIRYAC